MVLENERQGTKGGGTDGPDPGRDVDVGAANQNSAVMKDIGRLKQRRLQRAVQERQSASEIEIPSDSEQSEETGEKRGSQRGAALFSPSLDSLSSGGSFPDRSKKKPKFQVMLEKAREEEIRKHELKKQERSEKKPLFQRMVEKAAYDSDREEKQKLDEYKRSVEKKKIKIPPIAERSPHEYATPAGGRGGARAGDSSSSSHARADADSEYDSHDRHRDGDRRGVKQSRGGGGGKKSIPLFQRLAMQAKVEAERESKEKLDKYNMIRLQKQAAKAPTREELRERERQLEMDQDRLRDKASRKKQHLHGIERPPISRHVTPPPDGGGDHHDGRGGGGGGGLRAIRGQGVPSHGNQLPPKFKAKMSPLQPSQHNPNFRKIDDRGPFSSYSHAAHPDNTLDSRPVAYNEHATPLNPFGDDDRNAAFFSPLSMASVSGAGSEAKYGAHSGKKLGGVKSNGRHVRGPRMADDMSYNNDDDDETANDPLIRKIKSSPRMKRANRDDDPATVGSSAGGDEDDAGSKVRFQIGNGKPPEKRVRPPSGVSVGSVSSTATGGGGGVGGGGGATSMSISLANGPEWLSQVLETDEGELGMVKMYTEGFSIYMEESGII